MVRRPFALALAGSVLLSLSCSKKEDKVEQGSAPPPVASSKPGACASGGGTVSDTVSAAYFPRTAAGYCIDPNGDARTYGEAAKGTLETVCTELLDGECEVYKNYGLKRVVTLRYVDGAGSTGTVNVTASRFATAEGAYGFFTKRVVADGDPTDGTPKEIAATDTEVIFDVATNEKSPVGQHKSLFCQVTMQQSGEAVVQTIAGGGVLRIDAPSPSKPAAAPPVAAAEQAKPSKPISRLEKLRLEQAQGAKQ
jgi:hypothetical protein